MSARSADSELPTQPETEANLPDNSVTSVKLSLEEVSYVKCIM